MYPSRIRLSTSAHQLLLECERKWQLTLLLKGAAERSDSAIFSFGHGWGAGVVQYLLTGSLDAAVYHAWLAYWPLLEDDKRCEELMFIGLRAAKARLDSIRRDWEVATFNGKPAIELGFRLNINKSFYYESALDAALRHKTDNHYAVLENKHTMSWLDDITPMYKNSSQALIYSVILDKIVEQPIATYGLNYFVGQFKSSDLYKPIIHFFPWRKTLLDRLNFFIALGMDVQRAQTMMDMNIFPMRGHNCMNYGRVCEYFGTCQLRSGDRPKTDQDVEEEKTQHIKEIECTVQFDLELDDIIKDHLQRVREEIKTT